MSNEILTPRDYQRECIDAVAAAKWRGVQRPAVVLPTGAGKTVVFAHLAKLFREAFPARKIIIIAHTDELVTQAARKVKAVAPYLKVGIVMSGRHDIWADVLVCSVQSLKSDRRLADIRGAGLIVIDECHHATATSYLKILRHYGTLPPEDADDRTVNGTSDVLVVGFTATLVRSDRAELNEVWQEVVFRRDIKFMIDRGYLVRPRGLSVEVPDLDLSKIKRQGGDYQQKALSSAVVESMAPELVAKNYREHAADRSGILFWPSVEAAYLGAEVMRAEGFECGVIEGSMPPGERRKTLAAATSGDLQTLSSCMVLTEGFDNPRMSCAVIARPTRHAGLYQQMVGRVLRPHEESGKTDALVLDVVGAGKQFTLEALIDLEDKTTKVANSEREIGDELRGGAGLGPGEVIPYHGDTVVQEFDPLAAKSRRVWQHTEGTDTRFLAAGTDFYVFLAPGTLRGNWTVFWCRKKLVASADPYANGAPTAHAEIPLEAAMAWAEQLVDENYGSVLGEDYGKKHAPWRNLEPSEKARSLAARLGIRVAGLPGGAQTGGPVLNAGQLSDLIDRRMASRRIDSIVRALMPAEFARR